MKRTSSILGGAIPVTTLFFLSSLFCVGLGTGEVSGQGLHYFHGPHIDQGQALWMTDADTGEETVDVFASAGFGGAAPVGNYRLNAGGFGAQTRVTLATGSHPSRFRWGGEKTLSNKATDDDFVSHWSHVSVHLEHDQGVWSIKDSRLMPRPTELSTFLSDVVVIGPTVHCVFHYQNNRDFQCTLLIEYKHKATDLFWTPWSNGIAPAKSSGFNYLVKLDPNGIPFTNDLVIRAQIICVDGQTHETIITNSLGQFNGAPGGS